MRGDDAGRDASCRNASRYRRLLRIFFSAEVVRRHGDEMEATFLRLLDLERSRRGRRGAAAAWDVFDSGTPGMYRPLAPGEAHPVRIAIHVGDDPEAFTPRLRALAGEVDPAATISSPSALDEVPSMNTALMGWIKIGGDILLGILVTLSASGIYALMSFTVAERTREIGIRTALGAQSSSVVLTIAKRALVRLGVGILLGMPIVTGLLYVLKNVGRIGAQSPIVLTLLVGPSVMALIGMLACTALTLRALRIVPTEALREGR